MIRNLPPVLLLLGLACSAQPANARPTTDDASSPKTDARVMEAERLLAAGDPDGALEITDELLEADRDHRAARLVAARANIALFESGRSGAQWFLDDAIRQLEAALALEGDDPEALLDLSRCRLRKSEFDDGRELALDAARLLRERRAPDRDVAGALMQVAEHEMQLFADARRAELEAGTERPGDDTERLAVQVLATLRDAERLGARGPARVRASQVFQWLDRGTDALNELETGLRLEPQSSELHEAFQQLYWGMGMRAECVAAYKRLLRESKGSSAMLWYLGRAQVAHADDLRGKSSWDEAARVYAAALETFRSYDEQRPADHAGTAQWLAICELSLGRVAYEQGRLDDATAHFERAYDVCPLVAEVDENGVPRVYDSFGGNYLGGLSLVGQAISESTDADALARSLAFFERILERHPGRFASIHNNAALSARDLGVQIAGGTGEVADASDGGDRRERLRRAMELWEQSYAWYEKAAELAPDDARTLNDCGLMLVYHLHRDYDRARELFERAAALGEEQLAALPADADEQRRFLEEAVGDAWQNIGVLLADRLGRPASEARPFFEKAVAFYPNQRRDAARRLRELAAGGAGDQDPQPRPQQDPRKAKFDAQIGEPKAAAAAGDFDTALLAMDRMAEEMGGYAPYHFLTGKWSLGYAEQAAQAGGDAGTVDGLFNDALRHLRKAVELDGDPFEPRYELGRALLATGAAAEAARVADELLSHVRSAGGAPEDFLVGVHALRAEAAARAFVAKKQQGENDAELLRQMRASFREIETTPALDAARRSLWVAAEQWAEAPEQAVQVMVRAWQRDPALVGELVEAGARVGSSGLVVEALAGQEDATALWYAGKAHFDLAVQQWTGGEAERAIATLDEGIAHFERSMAANEAFRESAEQWIALCLGQKGLVQLSQDELAAAEESLLSAAERRPDVFTNDLGGGSSIKRGVLIVADRVFRKGDLGKTAAIYRRAGKAVPNDVDIANNEGLFCRDHADRLAGRRSGELTDELRELYEASYAAYTRASQLDPQSVRLRNDRALILVYSLKRDLELAEEILKSAIVDGEKQLEESPPEDEGELRALQEAVGDAYGNLGILYRDQQRWAAAREHFQKSLDYYPFQRRAGVRELQRLDELQRKAEEGKVEAGKQGAGGEGNGR